MKMTWSPEAAEQLRAKFGPDVSAFRLVYDTEGCGCAVNGVPALCAVDGPAPGDMRIDSEPFGLSMDPGHAVFFDDSLRLDWVNGRSAFRLSSDSQIYTTSLAVSDRRSAAAAAGVPERSGRA